MHGSRYTSRMGSDLERPGVWSRYWAGGSLHSLAGSFAGNYEGEILSFWNACFMPLPETHRVLDIGTGNGALPAIAWASRGPAMPAFDAVDIADIQPPAIRDASPAFRDKVRFLPHVQAEALPFPDHTFDLVASQYGFEYTRFDRSVPELARVLKPGGRLRLVAHHAASRLADVAREEVEHIARLVSADGLMDRAAALYAYASLAGAGNKDRLLSDPRANEARGGYNQAMRALQARIEDSAFPDVLVEARQFVSGQVHALLSGALPEAEAHDRHRDYLGLLADASMRSSELCAHALSEDTMGRFTAMLEAHGFHAPDIGLVHHQSMLLGWRISAST